AGSRPPTNAFREMLYKDNRLLLVLLDHDRHGLSQRCRALLGHLAHGMERIECLDEYDALVGNKWNGLDDFDFVPRNNAVGPIESVGLVPRPIDIETAAISRLPIAIPYHRQDQGDDLLRRIGVRRDLSAIRLEHRKFE